MKTFTRLGTAAVITCLLHASAAFADEPASAPTGTATTAHTTQAPGDNPLDVNLATAADFEKLPRVGPSRARAIVKMRERMGGFRRVEDLMRVRGIGRKTFRELRSLVKLGAAADKKAHGKHK